MPLLTCFLTQRLGLKTEQPEDQDKIINALLNIMQTHRLDFHSTFRRLSTFRPSLVAETHAEADRDSASTADGTLSRFIAQLCSATFEGEAVKAAKSWVPWLHSYAARLRKDEETAAWGGDWTAREEEVRRSNPRFVLRQWVLEEAIRRVKDDGASGKQALAKLHEVGITFGFSATFVSDDICIVQMASSPYERWGAEDDERPESELTSEEREERRVCGLGAKTMLGFQCSCSS